MPVTRGLTPHGLRRTHKPIMEEAGTPHSEDADRDHPQLTPSARQKRDQAYRPQGDLALTCCFGAGVAEFEPTAPSSRMRSDQDR